MTSTTSPLKRTFSAVASDGTVVTRTTHRVYTHAVLVGPTAQSPKWGAWSFNGRRDIAEREYRKACECWSPEGVAVELVEVTA